MRLEAAQRSLRAKSRILIDNDGSGFSFKDLMGDFSVGYLFAELLRNHLQPASAAPRLIDTALGTFVKCVSGSGFD